MREIAEISLQDVSASATIDAAQLAGLGIADDPVLADRMRRSNRFNVEQWLIGTILNPAEIPSYRPTEEVLLATLQNARAGLGEFTLEAFRLAEMEARSQWMQKVFEVTDNPDEIRAVLSYSHHSISTFVRQAAKMHHADILRSLADQAEGSPAQRLTLVKRILSEAPFNMNSVEPKLGYRLGQMHQAMILWGTAPERDPAELDTAVGRIAQSLGGVGVLSVFEDRWRRWIWAPQPISRHAAATLCGDHLRLAVGPLLRGVFAAEQSGQELAHSGNAR